MKHLIRTAMLGWLVAAAVPAFSEVAKSHFTQSFRMPGHVNQSGLDQVILITEYDDGSTSTQPITDIMLDVTQFGGDARAALMAPNNPERNRYHVSYMLGFTVVAEGRIFRDGGSICSPWKNDQSYCHVECDGGRFELLREFTEDSLRLTVRLRLFPEIFPDDASSAFSLGYCSEAEAYYYMDAVLGHAASFDIEIPMGWMK